jgi:hypothetical protein
MTDDLVKRLRDFDPHLHELEVVDEAADRIEALERERDGFEAALARACLVGGTTYLVERAEAAEAALAAMTAERERLGREVNMARYGQPDFAWSIHKEATADLEARLAKAVEALRMISKLRPETLAVDYARATLAEMGDATDE